MPLSVPIATLITGKPAAGRRIALDKAALSAHWLEPKGVTRGLPAIRLPSGSAFILRVCLGCCSGSCSQNPPLNLLPPSKLESSYVCHLFRPEEGPGQTGFANIHLRLSPPPYTHTPPSPPPPPRLLPPPTALEQTGYLIASVTCGSSGAACAGSCAAARGFSPVCAFPHLHVYAFPHLHVCAVGQFG